MTYQKLHDHFGKLGKLEGILEVLHWDWASMMPKGGAETRTDQMATLKVISHELMNDPRLPSWFAAARDEVMGDWRAANLTEMRRAWRHATAVPADLVEALSRAGSACENCWRTARAANDFASVEPLLAEVVSLVRKIAAAKSEALGVSPYDALLDQYEPSCDSAEIEVLFDDLADFLPDFTQAVLDHQATQAPFLPLEGPFAVADQRALGVEVMRALGFDFDHGRLDVSHHPFCGGTPDDVRITTRYYPEDFTRSLMGVIHETGHAMYERGLPTAWRNQPVGCARGMGFHESQSLLMEMQACRTREFIDFVGPKVRETFAGAGPAWTEDNLYRLYTHVERGLIRVDADEVTYPAHVILRYRLERALLSGDLQIKDLPGAWNEGMANLIGITPPDDRDGCLQDIHWMDGSLGYFPTYTLGAMTAAQLFDAACTGDPGIRPGLATGDFVPLLTWLRENVHQWGSRFSRDELLKRATGKSLDVEVFKTHLRTRYLGK